MQAFIDASIHVLAFLILIFLPVSIGVWIGLRTTRRKETKNVPNR